jgi:hypothetical protein
MFLVVPGIKAGSYARFPRYQGISIAPPNNDVFALLVWIHIRTKMANKKTNRIFIFIYIYLYFGYLLVNKNELFLIFFFLSKKEINS